MGDNETDLRSADEKYRALFDGLFDAVVIADAETGVILDVNGRASTLFGIPRDKLIGLHQSQLHPPEDLEFVRKEFRKAAELGNARRPEIFILRGDGERIPVIIAASSIDFGGRKAIVGIFRDQSDLKTAKNDSIWEWTSTLDNMPEVVVRVGPDGKIKRANKAASKVMGLRHSEIIGSDFEETIESVDPSLVECLCVSPGCDDKSGYRECESDKLGKVFLSSFSEILDSAGKSQGCVYVFEDITERKRLEEELIKNQKLESVGVLAGGIAHDFNNLLTAIWGNVSMALMETGRTGELAEMLIEAENACKRAASITKQLLTFAKGGEPIKKVVSLKKLLDESVAFVFGDSKSKCDVGIDEYLHPIEVDPGQIGQVFNNVLINADQSMPLGGTVRLKAENVAESELMALKKDGFTPSKAVKITIKDEGIGMIPQQVSRIFDPFYSTKEHGRGLGLATAHRIVLKHGGLIKVESNVGKGSEFAIYLPAGVSKLVRKKSAATTGRRVLVMDDEEQVRHVLGGMLASLGYEVAFAKNGEEALRIYAEADKANVHFDAVFLNLNVPGGMGGKDAIAQLRRMDPSVRGIVISGRHDDPAMTRPAEFGFSGVVAKPIELGTLQNVVGQIFKDVH